MADVNKQVKEIILRNSDRLQEAQRQLGNLNINLITKKEADEVYAMIKRINQIKNKIETKL